MLKPADHSRWKTVDLPIVYNLLRNSLKFSHPQRSPRIEITVQLIEGNNKCFHKITVADNGTGFDPAFNEQVFETFSRLNPKTEYDGTGLGLSLCRRIVQKHRGTIQAIGKDGEGATFIIKLPANENS